MRTSDGYSVVVESAIYLSLAEIINVVGNINCKYRIFLCKFTNSFLSLICNYLEIIILMPFFSLS